jgi:vacuolar-type H+-ATPase subunit C/Vma6
MLEAVFESSGSLAACQLAAESAKWRFLMGAAPDAGARAYLCCRADLANIKTLIRIRRFEARREALDAVWLPGGEIEPERFGTLMREEEDSLYSFLATTSYRRLLSLGLGSETALWKIGPLLKQALLESLGESRYLVFDFSPVLYHLELKERDYELLRMIIVGTINRLGEEMVLERMNALRPS